MSELAGIVGDKVPQFQFRDGKREVPAYLSPYFIRLADLHTMTYDQALAQVNNAMVGLHLGRVQKDIIRDHFGGM